MLTPLDEFMAKKANDYMAVVDTWRPQTRQFKYVYDEYKRWVGSPNGTEWTGRTSNAAYDTASTDCHGSDNTDDAAEDGGKLVAATIEYEVVDPLVNGQRLIESVLEHKNQGVSIDQTYHVEYHPAEGESDDSIARNRAHVADIERQIKEYVAKWEQGCQTLKTQADAIAQKITGCINPKTALVDGRKILRDAVAPTAGDPNATTVNYKEMYPKATDPASTQAAAVTATDPHAPVLGPPSPGEKPPVDPSKLGTIGGTVDYLNKNATPPTPPKPEPPKKGFVDGWVDAAKQKAEGIVEHVGDLAGLHGADKAKDAWVDVGIGVAKDSLKQAIPGAGTPSAMDQTIDAYNKAQDAKANGGSAASLAGTGIFDMQAKSAEATAAIATGGTGRFLERGLVEGAIGAEGRAALHEGVPTLGGTLDHTVKGVIDNALHPRVEAPPAPHVETPTVQPHAETPVTPHTETPTNPTHPTPGALHDTPAPGAHTADPSSGTTHPAPTVDHPTPIGGEHQGPVNSNGLPADTFNPHAGANYASGDPHYPGRWPPDTPAETWVPGETDRGWKYFNRGDSDWVDYQLQGGGLERTPDGRVPEFMQYDPNTGKAVAFDSFLRRGEQDVYLDMKNGREGMFWQPESDYWVKRAYSDLETAQRQLSALPSGAVLEWHVGTPEGAAALREVLQNEDIYDIEVIYTPPKP